jgi:SAM-dependent methyltransferase|eukprot:7382667-Prymnesium_polylepis.1
MCGRCDNGPRPSTVNDMHLDAKSSSSTEPVLRRSSLRERKQPDFFGRQMKRRFFDLFCGLGGASIAAELTGKYEVVLGLDWNERALAVFAKNFPGAQTICAQLPHDLRKLQLPFDAKDHLHLSPCCRRW